MIDFIGDIHGHADELETLLVKLGYTKKDNYYAHSNPNRSVLYVGDYIDRGPKIKETLEIVKQMVDNGSAIALMGNHEYNALCFHQKDTNGNYLREHSKKNTGQHQQTLDQFKSFSEDFKMYLEWFKTLPLFYETKTFKAVHACWDYKSIAYLKNNLHDNRLTHALVTASVSEGTKLFEAIDVTLKGKEITLPNGKSFLDKDKNERTKMRYKWWEDLSQSSYKDISMSQIENITKKKIDFSTLKNNDYYKEEDVCVFFGHYWLRMETNSAKKPILFKENICCLDYSVAKQGHLVAYSFHDEPQLKEQNFSYVKEITNDN